MNLIKLMENRRRTPKRLTQPVNPVDTEQTAQLVPSLNAKVTIRLKSLSKFWISFHLLLINYEVELDLSWTKDCVLTEHHYNITGVSYKITSSKFHVSAVTLSINDNIKVLENLKRKFKKTIFWNKYRYEITAQRKNNNLDCIIDPPFTNINSCLFFVH